MRPHVGGDKPQHVAADIHQDIHIGLSQALNQALNRTPKPRPHRQNLVKSPFPGPVEGTSLVITAS